MLDPRRTVLLAVDFQEKLLPTIAGSEKVLRKALLLLRAAQALDIPVRVTSQYRKGLGPVVSDVAALVPDAQPFDKVSFGCFGDEAFTRSLEPLPRGQILLCGIETHICVMQTALGARERGYEVHVAADAVGSRTTDDHQVGLDRMERAGVVPSSTEMAVYELLQRSDHPAFKALLPHLKG